jgi:hypothetical protein
MTRLWAGRLGDLISISDWHSRLLISPLRPNRLRLAAPCQIGSDGSLSLSKCTGAYSWPTFIYCLIECVDPYRHLPIPSLCSAQLNKQINLYLQSVRLISNWKLGLAQWQYHYDNITHKCTCHIHNRHITYTQIHTSHQITPETNKQNKENKSAQ